MIPGGHRPGRRLGEALAHGFYAAVVRTLRARPASVHVAVRALERADWEQVRDIYEAGIATGNATFDTAVPAWGDWDRHHLPGHRFVAVASGGAVVGWVALSPVSQRCVYAGVAEVSVYVAPEARGRGVGRQLLDAVVASSEAAGIWTLQAGIFPENRGSVALHVGRGFRIVGRRKRMGRLAGEWRDVILLERRSPVVT